MAGLDWQAGTETLLGVAVNYQRQAGTSGSADLGRFSGDSFGGSLYGVPRVGALILRGSAGLGCSEARIAQAVSFGGAPRTLVGDRTASTPGSAPSPATTPAMRICRLQ